MKSYLQSRTFWVNVGFLIAALFNAYAKNNGMEYELTGDQIMTALAIAGPLANKLLRFKTNTGIVLATPKTIKNSVPKTKPEDDINNLVSY